MSQTISYDWLKSLTILNSACASLSPAVTDTSESNFAYVVKTEATVPTNVNVRSAVFIQPCLDLFWLDLG